MHKLGMSLFAAALMLGGFACDDGAVDTAGNAGRCQKICNGVDECTGEDNDRECRMECTDNSENDDFEQQAEECASCIERDNSCSENVVQCAAECAGVVTLSST